MGPQLVPCLGCVSQSVVSPLKPALPLVTTDQLALFTNIQTHAEDHGGVIVWDIKLPTRAVAQPASLTSHVCVIFV